ncbi:MAG: DUF4258 domain-containing protein [Candidatus Levybacteria bacterium]|nr:DUF4258 domain-containing protein [Candidatus Levybacteria bacterium]
MQLNEFQGLILTNHALKRMSERGITKKDIWETYKFPDAQVEKENNTTERRKKLQAREISIIFKRNLKNEVIVLSCWMEPPLPGSKDAKEKAWWQKYKKAGFFKKFWLTFLKQLGL